MDYAALGAGVAALLMMFDGYNSRKRRSAPSAGASRDVLEKLDKILDIVAARDGDGNMLSHFPRGYMDKRHDHQDDDLADIKSGVSRTNDTLGRIEPKL